MQPKDIIAVERWLRSGASLYEVETTPRFGLVDNERWTPQAVRLYRLIWEWSAYRLNSERQDRAYRRLGTEGIKRRIERCHRLVRKHFGMTEDQFPRRRVDTWTLPGGHSHHLIG